MAGRMDYPARGSRFSVYRFLPSLFARPPRPRQGLGWSVLQPITEPRDAQIAFLPAPARPRAYTMTAAPIAAALGGGYRSGVWHRCICPVHQSSGPTLALRD